MKRHPLKASERENVDSMARTIFAIISSYNLRKELYPIQIAQLSIIGEELVRLADIESLRAKP